MLRDKQNRISQFFLILLLLQLTVIHLPIHAYLSSLAKNDALPPFTTLNKDDELLLTKDQLKYKDFDWAEKKHNRFGFFFSPFAQNADRGKTIKGQQNNITLPSSAVLIDTPLGDLNGRTGMIPLLYNNNGVWPNGVTDPSVAFASSPALLAAYNAFFVPSSVGFNSEGNIDPNQMFGYFSFPLTYRKRGVRFELVGRFAQNFGLRLEGGVSTIRQVREATLDLTSAATGFTPVSAPAMTQATVETNLMDQLDVIADQIHLGLCDFIKTSMEEMRINLFWRQAFEINKDAESDWAKFLLIPYIDAGFSGSIGAQDNYHQFFAVPFGNNTHQSVGFTAGINLDFLETIEIGGEIGYTHFFKKCFNMPMPNNEFQTNIFPFSTSASVSPGDNWFFGARIAAYHFVDNLSMYFEWFVLDHGHDEITLNKPDPAFVPGVLECASTFKTKLGNAGFNYDLSPNIGIGFLWQIPFSQRNSYRSSTLMAGFNVTF